MYRKKNTKQLSFEDFYLPFGGKLRSDNRWVKLAKIVPWELAESFYAKQFSRTGAPALSARIALGALIIKERLGVSDEEAVEQIRENPYLQYFLGFKRYSDEPPFDPSMYVHFRKRFTLEQLNEINEAIVNRERRDRGKGDDNDTNSPSQTSSCAPADIRYPTDITLVNETRQKSKKIINILFGPLKGRRHKPRTYRRKAPSAVCKLQQDAKKSHPKKACNTWQITAFSKAQPEDNCLSFWIMKIAVRASETELVS